MFQSLFNLAVIPQSLFNKKNQSLKNANFRAKQQLPVQSTQCIILSAKYLVQSTKCKIQSIILVQSLSLNFVQCSFLKLSKLRLSANSLSMILLVGELVHIPHPDILSAMSLVKLSAISIAWFQQDKFPNLCQCKFLQRKSKDLVQILSWKESPRFSAKSAFAKKWHQYKIHD